MSDMWTAYGVWANVGQNYRSRKKQDKDEKYARGWREGQIDLVSALRTGRVSKEAAAEYLSQKQPTPTPYHAGWFNGQCDLISALYDGRITLKAAALNLGMIAPGEE